jgi:hypothetical protein
MTTKKKKYPLKCSICGGDIEVQTLSGWADGHNAQPINDGRCCDSCNSTVVITARLANLARGKPVY